LTQTGCVLPQCKSEGEAASIALRPCAGCSGPDSTGAGDMVLVRVEAFCPHAASANASIAISVKAGNRFIILPF
jgi:hypothetical protein